MEWLRDLPWDVFGFGWGMVALLAGGSRHAVCMTVAAVSTWGATAITPSGPSDWRRRSLPHGDRDPEIRRGGAPGEGIRTASQGTFGPCFSYVERIIERCADLRAW